MLKLWQVSTLMSVAALAAGASSAAAQAAAKVTLSPATAPPGTPEKVLGSGFAAGEVVDVLLDGSAAQTTVATTTGALSTNLPLPASMKPGNHDITAVGRTSASGAHAALTITTPWTQEGFDGTRQSDNPYENQITQSTVGQLATAWIAAGDGSATSAPVVAGGRVFVTTGNGRVYAYKSACGVNGAACTPLWHADLSGNLTAHSPVVVGTMLLVRTTTALNAFKVSCASGGATCSPAWTAPLADTTMSPIGATASRAFLADGHTLKAFNATCGAARCAPVWTAPLDDVSWSGASVVNGVVYAGTSSDTLYAFSTSNGSQVWTATSPDPFLTDLTVANGRVLGSGGGGLHGFSTTCASSPCGPVWTGPGWGELASYVAAYGANLFVQGSGGLQRSSQTCSSSEDCIGDTLVTASSTPPALAGNVLYAENASATGGGHTHGALVAMTPDCTPTSGFCPTLWSFAPGDGTSTGEQFGASPVISDGTLYATTNQGRLFAFTVAGRAAGTTP